MKTAVYMRVSTSDQDISSQSHAISLFLQNRGIIEHQVYSDQGFTGKNESRPALKQLKNDIKAGKVQLLIVYKLDRLSRSLSDLLSLLELLKRNGVAFISIQENIDLTTSAGQLMMHMIGAFAEFERNLIVERTKSGLANAKAKGIQLGRPSKLDNTIRAEIKSMRASGLTFRQIQARTKLSLDTISRVLAKS